MPTAERPHRMAIFRRQAAACAVFGVLLALIVGVLYAQSRRREWALRCEQAKYRLAVAAQRVGNQVATVRTDALFLADLQASRSFVAGPEKRRAELTADFKQFVRRKPYYDQIRLLDLDGRETLRVNFANNRVTAVEPAELQDKSDRYYFQESKALAHEEVFISEFDLNQEHGAIERPLKPALRFVTPVVDEAGRVRSLLVLNYLGADLLRELDETSLPGSMLLLLRPDGHFLRGPTDDDAWGWLLGHQRTFATQFPDAWQQLDSLDDCQQTARGAFAMRRIPLGRSQDPADAIVLVWHLPRSEVFADSNALLRRLLALSAGVLLLSALFARPWARATLLRARQAERIAASEAQLRDLSSRLLRTQEDERRAVSREIHDELGQQVTAINLDLKLAERNLNSVNSSDESIDVRSNGALPHVQRAIAENETLLHTLHEFAKRVRPAVLDDLGLRDAIESHIAEFQVRTGVEVAADLEFDATAISDNLADNVYRLLQESLNNVAKHADATHVEIDLAVCAEPAEHFTMQIHDDGRGHDVAVSSPGLGLIGMRERAELLGGTFEITSQPNEGTTLRIQLPLAEKRGDSRP